MNTKVCLFLSLYLSFQFNIEKRTLVIIKIQNYNSENETGSTDSDSVGM